MRSPRLALACLALLCLGAAPAIAPAPAGGAGAVVAGTRISNTATASYGTSATNGAQFGVASNTIVTIVGAVSAVIVGPSENACNVAADSVDGTQPFTKTFTTSNTSNVRDAYVATVHLSAGTLLSIVATTANGTQTPLANGAELPALDPGETLRVAVTATLKSLALGTSIKVDLNVRSSVANAANGEASATASQCAIAARPASLGGVTLPAIPKLVDGVVSESKTPGAAVTYSIALHNSGGITARAAVLSDPIPAGIVPLPETATVDGAHATATLSGNRLTIPLGDIPPAGTSTIVFGADVADDAALGTSLVNVATASAANVAALASDPASVVVGYDDVVYDGYVGQALPVPGATITLVDPVTHAPLHGVPASIASRYRSSIKSASNGSYVMDMPLDHKTEHFEIDITAPSYRSRRIDAVLTPDASDTLYTVILTALDGQQLARPGAFALESGPIRLSDVYGVFGNLPLFRTQALTISKTVDRQVASAGDRLEYTITYASVGLALGATTLIDRLPPGVTYAPHTSRLDGKPLEPVATGLTLRWAFSSLVASHTMTLAAVISPGVPANATLTNLATVFSGASNTPAGALSASATVATSIVDGIFSDRTVVTGRVYVDLSATGSFRRGDSGVPFVRLFLETGESVLTDGDGRFSFPGVKPGMHVLRLDTATLPAGVRASDDRSYDSERSTRRLIHGVFDGGVMEDIDFAMQSVR